jgi:hypothetical protein
LSLLRQPREEADVKYLMLINLGCDGRDWQSLGQDDQKLLAEAWQAINRTQGVVPGGRLQPPSTATTVRVKGGEARLTDGPLVDEEHAIDGYLFFEADDLDTAINLASRIPAASRGGAVEVRPLFEPAGA